MDWPNVITAIVALYGAVLSTFTAIKEFKADRASIKVKMKYGFLSNVKAISETMLFVEAVNKGRKGITLASVGIHVPGEKFLAFIHRNPYCLLPHDLLPEKNFQFWIEKDKVFESLKREGFSGKVKINGFFTDQVGREYKSKSMVVMV